MVVVIAEQLSAAEIRWCWKRAGDEGRQPMKQTRRLPRRRAQHHLRLRHTTKATCRCCGAYLPFRITSGGTLYIILLIQFMLKIYSADEVHRHRWRIARASTAGTATYGPSTAGSTAVQTEQRKAGIRGVEKLGGELSLWEGAALLLTTELYRAALPELHVDRKRLRSAGTPGDGQKPGNLG